MSTHVHTQNLIRRIIEEQSTYSAFVTEWHTERKITEQIKNSFVDSKMDLTSVLLVNDRKITDRIIFLES